MKLKDITVDTPIFKKYGGEKGKVLGYAQIVWSGEYDIKERPFFDKDYCDLTIQKVTLKVGVDEQDITLAYQVSKQLTDTLAEEIEDAAFANAEYMFGLPNSEVPEVDHTDIMQDAPYSVIAIAERKDDMTIVSPIDKAA